MEAAFASKLTDLKKTMLPGRNKNTKGEYHGSNIVDILCLPNAQYGMLGVGTVSTI